MKIEIIKINGTENKFEAHIKNDEWVQYYNQYYEIFFANITSDIKMNGFRNGTIPSILLELKYPTLIEQTDQKSMFALIQNIYEELKKNSDYNNKNLRIDDYKLDDKTKNLIVFFHIKEEEKETVEQGTQTDEVKKEKKSSTKVKKETVEQGTQTDEVKKEKKSSTKVKKETVEQGTQTDEVKQEKKNSTKVKKETVEQGTQTDEAKKKEKKSSTKVKKETVEQGTQTDEAKKEKKSSTKVKKETVEQGTQTDQVKKEKKKIK